MKPYFPNKGNLRQNITLAEENVAKNDQEIRDELNSSFKRTVSKLEIFCNMFYYKSDFPNFKQRSWLGSVFVLKKEATILIFHLEKRPKSKDKKMVKNCCHCILPLTLIVLRISKYQ